MNWKQRYQNLDNLKPGDKVLIRNDLVNDERYGNDTFVYQMEKYRGKILTISKIINDKYYMEKDLGWNWTKEMFKEKVI